VSDQVEMAFTCNVMRPTIVLPRSSEEWSGDRRRAVLLHEVAHVRRRDLIGHTVASVACAVYWFNPLVWLAARRLRVESELACDDLVLDAGLRASDYAQHLLELVTGLARPQVAPAGALAIVGSKDFEGRLIAILDRANRRASAMGRTQVAVLLGVVLPITFSIAAVVPTPRTHESGHAVASVVADTVRSSDMRDASGPDATSPPGMTMTHVSVAPMVTVDRHQPDEATRSTDPRDVFVGCAMPMGTSDHRHDAVATGDATWTASGTSNDCHFDLASEGEVSLNEAATAIERIAPGGYIDVTTNVHGDVTRLVVRPSATGDVAYDFSRNGQQIESAAAAKAWVQDFLIGLDRVNAFAIESRFPLLLQAGGPDRVLDEVGRMHSEHAVSAYLMRLAQTRTLTPDEVSGVLAFVTRMDVDHDRARVLLALVQRQRLDAELRSDVATVAATIRDAGDRVRVLTVLARR